MLSLYLVPIRVLSPSLPVLTAAKATAEQTSITAPAMITNNPNFLAILAPRSMGLFCLVRA